MNATHGPITRCPEHHRGSVSGSVQVGPARLIIEEIEPNRYGEGKAGIHYRVEADIVGHWSARPLPGAVWTMQSGIASDTEAELRERVAMLYGVGRREGSLLAYRGPMRSFPYRSAISDAQATWLRARGVEIIGTGATITLRRNGRAVDVRADGSGCIGGAEPREVTAREAVSWLVAE